MTRIDLPVSEKAIRKLEVGQAVELYGTIVTARDAAHKYMVEHWPEFIAPFLKDGAIYHCGPVMKRRGAKWEAVSAGPTTSTREDPYEAEVMAHYGVRVIIGKGGMGERTIEACGRLGAVYLHAIGGAAVRLAESIKQVRAVHLLGALGVPEAFWVCEVAGFPGTITIDSRGESLHERIRSASDAKRRRILGL